MIEITEVKKVKLEPGDTVVIRTQKSVSNQQRQRIISKFQEFFPGHQIIILDDQMDLFLIGK